MTTPQSLENAQDAEIAPGSLLGRTLAAIVGVDEDARAAAEARQIELTKPIGSLGQLEEVGNQLAAIQRRCPPTVPQRCIAVVFAGDHGLTTRGISPWHREVTVQMLINCCRGGASINALAKPAGIEVWPVDVGVACEVPDAPGLRRHRVRSGTADICEGPAMTRHEAIAAIEVGVAVGQEAIAAGADCLIAGEIGIGNTTVAAGLIAAFTGTSPEQTTGRGAGSGDAMLQRKIDTLATLLAAHQLDAADPIGVVAAIGGLEHAAMAGLMLAGAAAQVPVLLDGVIACSAALIADVLAPHAREYMIAGHAGAEPGIVVALDRLDKKALVDLGMRLGEGGGAAIAFPIVQAAAYVLTEMGTFSGAGVNPEHK